MRSVYVLVGAAVVLAVSLGVASLGADKPAPPAVVKSKYFETSEVRTSGSIREGFGGISYDSVAGTLIVHPKGWDDAANGKDKSEHNPDAEASMFYVAYFRKGENPGTRPIMFLFNGGPGSSSVWLHMGAFGPKRVVTASNAHTAPAPYKLVDNADSLLDVSDLVFVDAPGTGFSRIAGKDDKKAFYGVDQDVHAFSSFITQFLSKYGRWNSPKYLLGESYGTPRAAALVNVLEQNDDIDFNGVILLSQILNFDLSDDQAYNNPGMDMPYILALPTYAATAWYHDRLPGKKPADLVAFVQQVERFATTDYQRALEAGNSLNAKQRQAIADKLHQYTGLPVSYILRANLRIDGGEFEQNLQGAQITTGRLDTRFSGPSMDPLAKEAGYDPQSAAISSAYVSAFNNYVRADLKYGQGQTYKPEIDIWSSWDYRHKPPGSSQPLTMAANVLPDLAAAMQYDPDLKIMVNGGYFDLATPYYEGWYEMHHLAIQPKLMANIEFHYYRSGHMIYAREQSLQHLHDNIADFVRRTDNVK